MIEIKILDKRGAELKNGDTVRYASIIPTYFDDDFWAGKDGVNICWEYYLIDPYKDLSPYFSFHIPNALYDKAELLSIFEYRECSDEEYEGILSAICNSLNIEFTNENELFEKINGIEIVDTTQTDEEIKAGKRLEVG